MPKYYLSKTNSGLDNVQANNSEYAILMNNSEVRFFQNHNHIINLNYSGTPRAAKSTFSSSLGSEFTKFFSGDSPAGTSTRNNAFAYMRANGGWPA